MANRLEIALRPDLFDAEGEGIRKKARDYFDIAVESIRTVQVVTIDARLTAHQLKAIQKEIFTNPVTQISSFEPLSIPFDWTVWVGLRPGVRDNPGATAMEAIEDLLQIRFQPDQAVYSSRRYCVSGAQLAHADIEKIAGELLANDIIQQWKIYARKDWVPSQGIGIHLPKVILNHVPEVGTISIDSEETLKRISKERGVALNPHDVPTVRNYFLRADVREARQAVGLSDPTDIELEYICQARSDHCNHNTFRGKFYYREESSGRARVVDNLFKTCIEAPTLALKTKKPWVVSVLWDNAGVGRFDDQHNYVITGETHNSPSNMEAYGGAITGIVGVYRDPMGTGKGSRLIMGSFGYCVGPRDYQGELKPHLHPRRLLDGVIEGVRDGGNKSGIPTPFGQVIFHPCYMGKCLVFVTALGLMPATVKGAPADQKQTTPGDLILMCGGRVGKDGIHGVTASSEIYSESTPAGHVQIGDPYTQKKMHDFLLEARDEGLIAFITDNGGGGLSSSVGESARWSNGAIIELEKVPLKYEGLDQWEIWVSESQERMTVAIKPQHLERFLELSRGHGVESTLIGTYTDSGRLHITYEGQTCAYVDLDLLTGGFPQWEFDAEWRSPESRGLTEPVLSPPVDYNQLIKAILARPNICSKEWIYRQYDHEVQGSSVIKPLVGSERDMNSDAVVLRPVLPSLTGLAFGQALLPWYSAIDAYHMTSCTIDEAVRRLVAVGADPDNIGGVDNFCWPNVQFHPVNNPDGKFKAAQLVRSCWALRDFCMAYEIPLLSGKDSMYVDGHLKGLYGETHKVSALETLQFSTTAVIEDVTKCITMDAKISGDLVYILGETRNELGASEYYELMGYTGCNVPTVDTDACMALYRRLHNAINQELVASVHGVYRGGLGVHLAWVAMGANLGLDVNLDRTPTKEIYRDDTILFSETPGRFIVTVDPDCKERFEKVFETLPLACIGTVTDEPTLHIKGISGKRIVNITITELKTIWKEPYGQLT